MARYSRINEEDADKDSVALMLGQRPPRLSRFGGSDYIQLDNLDPENSAVDPGNKLQDYVKNVKKKSHSLFIGIFIIIFSFVLISIFVSIHRRQHLSSAVPSLNGVLSSPLSPETRFYNGTIHLNRTTLVISIEGMHPHYISPKRTPRLDEFSRKSFSTPFMNPSFPTQTFPNHWTLVTGMYPIHHGIIGNTFYDPELDLEFVNTNSTKSLDRRLWGGEPVWTTAKKYGVSSAVHMWPGCEVDWGQNGPDELEKFNADESLNNKLSKIFSWLDRNEPPQLMLAYVPLIGLIGHQAGIAGPKMAVALAEVDSFIGNVIDGLKNRNLTDIVNLVLISDHGMAPTSNERIVILDKIITNFKKIKSIRGWPMAGLRFDMDEQVSEAYASLKYYEDQDKENGQQRFKVYKVDEMPSKWHFGLPKKAANKEGFTAVGAYDHRLAPIYILPEPGFSLVTNEDWDAMNHDYSQKGTEGYDSAAPLMRAVFLAQGPAFPFGRYVPFNNVDVYSAICRSLGFPESPHSDGSFHGVAMTSPIAHENYPGLPFEEETFRGSSFDVYYRSH